MRLYKCPSLCLRYVATKSKNNPRPVSNPFDGRGLFCKQAHLLYLAGHHCPVPDDILWADLAAEQWGIGVVCLEIPVQGRGRMVGIAVAATVGAGVVQTDIHGSHAAAFPALVGVLLPVKGLAGDSLKKLTVDTTAVGDAEFNQVDGLGTGLQGQAVSLCGFGEFLRQFPHLPAVRGTKAQLLADLSQMPVIIQKAQHAPICVPSELPGHRFKPADMILGGVFGGQQDWIIPPDDPFRTDLP